MPDISRLQSLVDFAKLSEEKAFVEAIYALGKDYHGTFSDIDGAGDAMELLRKIADNADDADLKAAFEAIGAGSVFEALAAQAKRLDALLDKVPDKLVTLLEPLDSFGSDSARSDNKLGAIDWLTLDKDSSASGGGSGEASYELEFEGGLKLDTSASANWSYSDTLPAALLRLRAGGQLKAKAAGSAPLPFGSLGGGADARVSTAIEYYFAPEDRSQFYGLALASRFDDLINPFDFDSIWNGFASSDLAAVHYTFDGEAGVELKLALAKAFSVGHAVDAKLGATIEAAARLEGSWNLSLMRDPAAHGQQRIIVKLSRSKTESAKLAASLGADIDMTKLSGPVHAILQDALGKWDSVLEDVRPYLAPGTLLRKEAGDFIKERATDLIDDAGLRDALVRDLEGMLGAGEPGKAELVEWMTEQLTGALDSAQGWAGNKAKGIANLVAALGDGVPALSEAQFGPMLQGKADELISEVGSRLATLVSGKSANAQKKLGRAVSALGVQIDGTVNSADDAMQAVTKLIERYDTLFREVVEASKDAARYKISANLQIEESRQRGSVLEFSGAFTADTKDAKDAFRAITRGRMGALIGLLRSQGGNGVEVDSSSSLRRFVSSGSARAFDLVAFGFGLKAERLLSADTSVMVDGEGNVQIDSRSSLMKRFKGEDAEREITLLSSFALKLASSSPVAPSSAQRTLGLAIAMGHIDDNLERHEVMRFVGSLVESGLIAQASLDLAEQTWTEWAGNGGSESKIPGRLLLKLALDQAGLEKMLLLGTNDGKASIRDEHSDEIRRQSFAIVSEEIGRINPNIRTTIAYLKQEEPGKDLDYFVLNWKKARNALRLDHRSADIHDFGNTFLQAARMGEDLVDMIESYRKIYFSVPEVEGESARGAWDADDYHDEQKRIAKRSSRWLQLNSSLFWTNSKVHPRVIALLKVLAQRARIDIADHLSLSMTYTGNGGPKTVVLLPDQPADD